MTAAKDSNCYLYGSSDMGDVVKITNPNGSNNTGHSLTFKIDDSYGNLDTNAKVTVYALVRCLSTGDLHFGWNDGSEAGRFMLSLSAIAEKAPTVSNNPNKGTTNKIDTIQFGYTTWYLCYRTFTPFEILGSSSKRDYTVNTITGSWLVHSVGIIRSEIIPTIDSIIHDNGYKSAGIDITSGKIDLYADKVSFKNKAGDIEGKVWIDTDKGTLHAVDGEFSGIVKTSVMYGTTKLLGNGNYTIGSDGLYYTYCISANSLGSPAIIFLPNPNTYDGLELRFFAKFTTRNSASGHIIYPTDPGINYGTVSGSSDDPVYILTSTTNSLLLIPNQFVTVKAMDGAWYVVSGQVKLESNS